MDGTLGHTLLNAAEMNFNIHDHHEDDEEDIEEEKMRKEMLNAQLEHAFDDCWDDSEHEDSGNSSSSDEEGKNHKNTHRSHQELLFRKLSSISERSPNKTNSSENSVTHSKFVFSPQSAPYAFQQMNVGNGPPMDGRGDESPQIQQVLKNKLINGSNGPFQPLFLNSSLIDKSHVSVDESQEGFTQTDKNGFIIDNQPYQPIFNNNSTEENGEKFQHEISNKSVNGQSQESIDAIGEAYRQAEYNSVEQLRVLYEVRMREIKELQAEKLRAANQQQEAMRRLALLEAEKQRAVMSRTEASKLLVACKEEIGKLQKEVETQKQTITTLEKDKAKSDDTAEMLRVHVQELEQRIEMMERFDSNKAAAKHTEAMIKELKNKQQQEVKLMQREMDSLKKKLSKKEEVCRELEHKVTEQQRAHELLLVEKSDTINQLARRLEESQGQCSQLMSSNVTVENVRLQNQLSEALREKEELSQTVRNLQAECSIIRADLTQYESLSRLTQPHCHSSSDETDSITQMGISSRSKLSGSNLNTTDMVAKLKDELHRALLNQKAKRAEIQRLQETIQDKDKQIREITEQERVHLTEMDTLRDQLNTLMREIKSVKNQNESEKDSSHQSKSEEVLRLGAEVAELNKEKAMLEREKMEVSKKLDSLTKRFEQEKRKEISDHNQEYLKFHDEIVAKVRKEMEEEAELKIKEYSVRLEESLKEVNEVKSMYVAVCAAKEEISRQLEETRTQLLQLTTEMDQLTSELAENKKLNDRLAKSLNEVASPSGGGEGEMERLRRELKEYMEMRDHLARRVNTAERENAKLAAEMDKLKEELENRLLTTEENQDMSCAKCGRLQEELTSMSGRHTHELTTARAELQAARDRLLQLEKTARQQFDTEIKSLRQERDQLKAKCDEKEVQIKKLIESRKRTPTTVNTAAQTEWGPDGVEEDEGELEKRLREEYEKNLAVVKKAQQDAVEAIRQRNKEEMEKLRQEHQQAMELLIDNHQKEVREVEDRTKQTTLQFCAAQIKRMEENYLEEACRRVDPGVVAALQSALRDRSNEVEKLKQQLADLEESNKRQLAALQHQMDSDKDKAAQLMMQWVHELKNVQGELKIKEAIIDDQRSQIQKARAKVQKLRNQIVENNKKFEEEYTSKCNQYKAEFVKMAEEREKLVNEKVQQLKEEYQKQIKELKKNMKNKHSNR